MTLSEKQRKFTKKIGQLICWAYENGFELSFGDAFRSPEEAERLSKLGKGIKDSLHCKRLAIDLNLFKDGKYMDKSEDYRPLGKFWESLSTDDFKTCWGGRFVGKPDGNHFSVRHEGKA